MLLMRKTNTVVEVFLQNLVLHLKSCTILLKRGSIIPALRLIKVPVIRCEISIGRSYAGDTEVRNCLVIINISAYLH